MSEETILYVAINGNDGWSGKFAEPNIGKTDGPFATLERARDWVREFKSKESVTSPIKVVLREGKYYLNETLRFGPEDGGSRKCRIRYQAYEGERAVLSGGRKLTDWRAFTGEIVCAQVESCKGGVWKFRQLFLNGEPQIRARYPKYNPEDPLYGGWLFMEGPAEQNSKTSFRYRPGTFSGAWTKPTNGEVFVFPAGGWTSNIIPIKSVDMVMGAITLTRPVQDPDRAPWFFPQPFYPGDRFRVENLLEHLTAPGEWCLDPQEGKVYFWPPDGPLRSTDDIVAPALETLIEIRGASWLAVSGLTFTETLGGDDVQRDGLEGYGPTYPNQGWKYCGDALHLREAEHCLIENNQFYAVGGNAIYLERYNARNIIRHNEINRAGAHGVCLLGNRLRHAAPDYVPVDDLPHLPWINRRRPMPISNEVTDNFIHHCGVLNKYTAGIFLGVSDGNLVAHNRIEYLPQAAISLGQNSFGRNVVEYNEIRHVCQETAPAGAVHSWMDEDASEERVGHVIRFNLIADVHGCATSQEGRFLKPHPQVHAIYLDNYTSNCFVIGNVIARVWGNGVFIHSGKNNFIENNIVIDALGGAFGCGYGFNPIPGFLTGHQFCRNITYFSKQGAPLYHFLLYEWRDDVVSRAEWNLFYCQEETELKVRKTRLGETMQSNEFSLAEWRELGFDTESIVETPGFCDPFRDDYRLHPDAPAIRLGFVPIDLSVIGIREPPLGLKEFGLGKRSLSFARSRLDR